MQGLDGGLEQTFKKRLSEYTAAWRSRVAMTRPLTSPLNKVGRLYLGCKYNYGLVIATLDLRAELQVG